MGGAEKKKSLRCTSESKHILRREQFFFWEQKIFLKFVILAKRKTKNGGRTLLGFEHTDIFQDFTMTKHIILRFLGLEKIGKLIRKKEKTSKKVMGYGRKLYRKCGIF